MESRFQFAWTVENIERLRTLAALGWSGGKIANDIGCSRNAVIGKMSRNGIKSTNATGHQVGVPAPWKKAAPKPAPKPNMMTINARKVRKEAFDELMSRAANRPERPVERPADMPVCRTTFEELSPGGCRWPEGDGPFLFCGEPQVKDRPYCGPHCAIAYQPTARLTKLREQYEVAA